MSSLQEKKVSNNQTIRGFSDYLDSKFWNDGYKDNSISRGVIHGVYHYGVGTMKGIVGNFEGAKNEYNRGN